MRFRRQRLPSPPVRELLVFFLPEGCTLIFVCFLQVRVSLGDFFVVSGSVGGRQRTASQIDPQREEPVADAH